jgi:preprotein translocase subunit YajC
MKIENFEKVKDLIAIYNGLKGTIDSIENEQTLHLALRNNSCISIHTETIGAPSSISVKSVYKDLAKEYKVKLLAKMKAELRKIKSEIEAL